MQYIKIDDVGNKFYYKDKEMSILHRKDGPAIEWGDGGEFWYLNKKLHRKDGPAVELSSGTKEWYRNGKRHRKDGPAVELSSGAKYWWLNGKLHRKDGPAIELSSGTKYWWLNGEKISKEEHSRRTQKTTELTLNEIAEKFNIPVEKLRIKE